MVHGSNLAQSTFCGNGLLFPPPNKEQRAYEQCWPSDNQRPRKRDVPRNRIAAFAADHKCGDVCKACEGEDDPAHDLALPGDDEHDQENQARDVVHEEPDHGSPKPVVAVKDVQREEREKQDEENREHARRPKEEFGHKNEHGERIA